MTSEILIWGTGGHAKVVFDAAIAVGYKQITFIDDAAAHVAELFGCAVISSNAAELNRANIHFIVAVGDNQARARCYLSGLKRGWTAVTLVHPSAVISTRSKVGNGSVVLANAVINAGASIGKNCIINTAAIVEHDCLISDHAHISPSATLGGNVTVGAFTHIGLNSSVLPGLQVGSDSVVGAGAVVLRQVPEHVSAIGVPARIVNRPKKTGKEDNTNKLRERILLSVPHMGGLEQQYVEEAFASNWLSTVGPNVTAFEKEFGDKLRVNAVAVSSGTAAIHLGLRALGVGPGDTVFCSDLTFVASANPIVYLGAEPVFIDSNANTWNMDPEVLAEALADANRRNRLPKAVVVVHLFGQCADMDPILAACAQYEIPVLEDAAEALGATYKGKPAGTLGTLGAFSFNGNKMITTTGGGMLVSKDPGLICKAQFWATQAREAGTAYHHCEVGHNYRISNVLAGIGRGQLQVLDERVQQRRAVAFTYANAFSDLPGISFMPQADYGLHTNWLSCFLIDEAAFGCSRDELIQHLEGANIESRPVWKPMHWQPLYRSALCYGGRVSESLFEQGICLPSSSSLSRQDQEYVIEQVRQASARHSFLRLAGQVGYRQNETAHCISTGGQR